VKSDNKGVGCFPEPCFHNGVFEDASWVYCNVDKTHGYLRSTIRPLSYRKVS
jgi:hypothetical protein